MQVTPFSLVARASHTSASPNAERSRRLTRELRAKATSCEHTVAHWTTFPPSDSQRAAMFDLVATLHAHVARASVRPPQAESNRSVRAAASDVVRTT